MAYTIFTTDFDRVVHARDMGPYVDPESHEPLCEHSKLLDPAAGEALASNLGDIEGEAVVLVDMSGSNRGSIAGVVGMVDGICLALEAKGVPFQVLGFTTSSWKGGEPRKAWVEDGRPRNPGRLCDLLHVVFKDRGETWASTRQGFRDAYRHGVLKENVDGEAVRWALSRMQTLSGSHLVHVGDGAPVDDSTQAANHDSGWGTRPMENDLLRGDYARSVGLAEGQGVSMSLIDLSAYDKSAIAFGGRPERSVSMKYAGDPVAAAEQALATAFQPAPSPAP